MGKSAILLILVGLAAGLWLGFNPTTHRDIQRWWTRTAAGQETVRPSAAVNLRQLDRRFTLWLRTASRPENPPAASSSPAPTGTQISATVQAFFNALQRLWLQFLLKLGISRA